MASKEGYQSGGLRELSHLRLGPAAPRHAREAKGSAPQAFLRNGKEGAFPFVREAGRQGRDSRRAYGDALDRELIDWSAAGDRRAFDEVATRYGPFALRVAFRLLPDRLVAEDVVQEAMMRAWSQSRHFDPVRARFRTWLYRIVVNLSIDQRRQVQPARIPDHFDLADPAAGADEMVATNERDAALAAALRELPVSQRAAMTLVYDEGISGAEAARVLGLSAKAVERLLARGRAYLRKRMQADYTWKET